MAQFRYTAQTAAGDTYERTIDAPDRFAVYTYIRKEGATLLTVEEAGGSRSLAHIVERVNAFISRIKEQEKIILARNLAAMIQAGLSLSRALQAMERQSRNPKLKQVLASLNADISKGKTLHDALDAFPNIFSELFRSMVRAGEESGRLAPSLLLVSTQMERAYNLKKKVRGALIYPVIVIIAMVGIGILMLMFVVPTLTQTFSELGAELPLSTKVVLASSSFLTNHFLVALLLFLVLAVGITTGLRTPRGRRARDYVVIHIPIIGEMVKEVNAARTTRTLASLLSSGVEVVHALDVTRDVLQNSYFKEVLDQAKASVERGEPINTTFSAHEHLYPVLVGEMIAVGVETGKLADMLEQTALFYEAEVEQKTKDLSTVIEPFLMLFIGSVVGIFAVSMIAPIYSISNSI